MGVTFLEDVSYFVWLSPSLEPLIEVIVEVLPRFIPIFENSFPIPTTSLPLVVTSSPTHHYSHHPRAPPPLPESSSQ